MGALEKIAQFHAVRESVHRALAVPNPRLDEMVSLFEGDHEYEVAANIRVQEYTPVVEVYRRVAETFYKTVARIQSLHVLPINLAAHMYLNATAHASASFKAGYDPADFDYKETEHHAQHALEAQSRILATIKANYPGGLDRYFYETGANAIKDILKQDIDAKRQDNSAAIIGIEAMLAAIVTAGYAALETMAEDLWVAAANRHNSLGMNWLSANKRTFDGDVFATYGPNFSGRMGTFLTQTRKVQFQSLSDIKRAYEQAFGGAVDSAFALQKDVRHAEKVRHLIAHRAGIVDAKFKEEMKELPEYNDVQVDQQIPLNGQIVLHHLLVCVMMGQALLKTVDDWSATAPTP